MKTIFLTELQIKDLMYNGETRTNEYILKELENE